MPTPEKSETLIVDTAAFVRNVPLWELAERLITCEDVIREIRDKQTQRQVESYPVPIDYRSATAESIRFVTEFTKKTGDYAVLSAADIKVLALAYEIEVETHGSDHLRLEPLKRVTNNIKVVPVLKNVAEETEDASDEDNETKSNDVDDEGWCVIKNTKRRNRPKNDDGTVSVTSSASRSSIPRDFSTFDLPPGFHYPKEKNPVSSVTFCGERTIEDIRVLQKELLQVINVHLEKYSYVSGYHPKLYDEHLFAVIVSKLVSMAKLEPKLINWVEKLQFTGSVYLLEALEQLLNAEDRYEKLGDYPNVLRWFRHISSFDLADATHCELHSTTQELLLTLDNLVDQSLNDSSIAGEEDSDDDDGWITPDNVNRIKKGLSLTDKLEFEEAEEDVEESTVACITGDFAMQNVLHHIGLRVLGVDGKVIKDTRTYTLRCFACYKLCPDMTKLFCPNCGNRTLKRVSITLNSDGSQNVWISSRRINTRGMRFNLPKPRSGKHARMPLMTADQRFPQQWAKKSKSVDVMSAEYTCRSSPFSQNDITSRAASFGYRNNNENGINGQLMHARIWKPKRKH